LAEIVLVQPHTGSWDEMSTRPPDSLLAVAAVPHRKGYSVKIIDQRLSTDFWRELDDNIGPETVLVGLTAITGPQIRYALGVARYVKRRHPRVRTVWGGIHASLLPEETARDEAVDFVVAADGDLVLCELFERLREGKPVEDLRGIAFRRDGEVVNNAGRVVVEQAGSDEERDRFTFRREGGSADILRELDELPDPPWELADPRKYKVFVLPGNPPSTTLNTSRGCPHRCRFCSDPLLNEGKWRGFSAGRVLEMVGKLRRDYGIGAFYFQDDYFPGPKPRFLEILEGLARYDRKLLWATLGIRADTVAAMSKEELDLLWKSGCFNLDIGIEAGSPAALRRMNKGETIEQMRACNEALAPYDIVPKYTILCGLPGETEEDLRESLRLANELREKNPRAFTIFFVYAPIAGTPLYEESVAAGFQAPTSLAGWAEMDWDNWMESYRSWTSPRQARRLLAISFTSYFASPSAEYKYNSPLLRLAFRLYHPIARWRFRTGRFGFFAERWLRDAVLGLRERRRRRSGVPPATPPLAVPPGGEKPPA